MLSLATAIAVLPFLLAPAIKAEPTISPLFDATLNIGPATDAVESRGAQQNAVPITSGTISVTADSEEVTTTEGQINGGTIYVTQFSSTEEGEETEGEDVPSEGTQLLAIDFHGTYGGEAAEGEEESSGAAFFGRQEGLQSGTGQVGRVQITAGGEWAFLTDTFILCETIAQTEEAVQVSCYSVQGQEVATEIQEDAVESDEPQAEETQDEEPVEEQVEDVQEVIEETAEDPEVAATRKRSRLFARI